ncbi:hypothetical protein [Paraburkholderia antibiotica]|uniref:Uncharacterized protein n=1 Tax=Paraburkholderia antibiotica TaxID=2728839 RepID=A0A7X9X9A9_9BURK|nr:hypothetical protein [Paraburkholderia antibiotica]NML33825.1 hypothetical protein [Paraburkholderia antibiotica]
MLPDRIEHLGVLCGELSVRRLQLRIQRRNFLRVPLPVFLDLIFRISFKKILSSFGFENTGSCTDFLLSYRMSYISEDPRENPYTLYLPGKQKILPRENAVLIAFSETKNRENLYVVLQDGGKDTRAGNDCGASQHAGS